MHTFPYASNYKAIKVGLKTKYIFFYLILPLKPSIGKWENADLNHFTSKPFHYNVITQRLPNRKYCSNIKEYQLNVVLSHSWGSLHVFSLRKWNGTVKMWHNYVWCGWKRVDGNVNTDCWGGCMHGLYNHRRHGRAPQGRLRFQIKTSGHIDRHLISGVNGHWRNNKVARPLPIRKNVPRWLLCPRN